MRHLPAAPPRVARGRAHRSRPGSAWRADGDQRRLALRAPPHNAFDRHIVGIRPDYRIEIRTDILAETDGPMLKHGLQGFQGEPIHRPHRRELWPRLDFLEERYERFRKAG